LTPLFSFFGLRTSFGASTKAKSLWISDRY